MNYKNLEELIAVIAKLRAPDGCPWDREQTHNSLRPNMLEEAYEAVDAIDENNMAHLREELGDVLWFVAELATCLEVDLDLVAETNLQKLASRKARGVIGGDGDDR